MEQDRNSLRSKSLKLAAAAVLVIVVVIAGYSSYQGSQTTQRTTSALSTTQGPITTGRYAISVKWLGHATFRIDTGNASIYIDPYEGEFEGKADVILVTHSHGDHMNTSKIGSARRDSTLVIAPADCVTKIGGTVKSLKPGEKASFGNIVIEAVEAYNFKRFRSPGNPYHLKGLGVGYLVTVGAKTIYHAGDTDFIPEMKELKNVYLALLPTGGQYTMDNPEAVEAILAIKPRFVVPMHRQNSDPSEIKREAEAKSDIRVILLNPSEAFQLE